MINFIHINSTLTEQIYVLVNLLCYFIFEGIREAYYYHEASKTDDKIKDNLHFTFFLQRFIIFVIIFILGYNPFLILASILMFSFIHDGFYYYKRNILNPAIYPKKFMDHSTTSTAILEFGFPFRLFMFVNGLALFVITLIYIK